MLFGSLKSLTGVNRLAVWLEWTHAISGVSAPGPADTREPRILTDTSRKITLRRTAWLRLQRD